MHATGRAKRYDEPRPGRLLGIAAIPLAEGWRWHRYRSGIDSGRWVENDSTVLCLDCGASFSNRRVIGPHNGWHNRRKEYE